jgi:type II secretory ATPase GspE/PulE/Tfp pilus assembly ATPase PilB-like protein
MNPFVNPKKRHILLPKGCKDLIDVLRLPARETADPVEIFIREMLLRAEGVNASEILIGGPMVNDGECIITQRISGTLWPVSTIPAGFRASIVAQLLRMAGLAEATFPAHGVATLQLKRRQVKWNLQIESPEADCQLTSFEDGTSDARATKVENNLD